jgi:hypothetical protein
LIRPTGLAISLPAQALAALALPGSVVAADSVLEGPLPPLLKAALRVVTLACRDINAPALLVARPEVFTNGPALSWLRGQLGSITDHLAISDGSTLALLPGLCNHLFFVSPGDAEATARLGRLLAWAGELPGQFSSQVNTSLHFRLGSQAFAPQTIWLQARAANLPAAPEFLPFYLNPDSLDDSLHRLGLATPLSAAQLSGFRSVTYVRFTTAAAQNKLFCREIVRRMLNAITAPEHLVLLGAPACDSSSASLSSLLRGLLSCGARLPRALLPNVLIAPQPVGSALLPNETSLILPESFEFWHLPPSYYAGFKHLLLATSQPAHAALFTQSLGRAPEVLPLAPPPRGTFDGAPDA